MTGFTYVDAGVAVVILLSAILAYARGFVREVLAILGWAAAAAVAFVFAPNAEPLVKEIPVIGDFIADSCELSMITAFAAVFAVALVIASFITPLFASAVRNSALGHVDQGLGFLFGALRGVVLVGLAFFLYQTVMGGEGLAAVDDSRSAEIFARMADAIREQRPERALDWITQQYEELTGNCTPGQP